MKSTSRISAFLAKICVEFFLHNTYIIYFCLSPSVPFPKDPIFVLIATTKQVFPRVLFSFYCVFCSVCLCVRTDRQRAEKEKKRDLNESDLNENERKFEDALRSLQWDGTVIVSHKKNRVLLDSVFQLKNG